MTDRTRGVVRWTAVAATTAVAGALWVVLGLAYSWAFAFPTFLGACERIKASGLPLLPTDRMCFASFWDSFRVNYSLVSFLQVAGVVLAGVLLAAMGRRWTAFLPVLAVLVIDGSHFTAWKDAYGIVVHQGLGTWELAAALLCAPVLVAVLLRQEPVPERLRARWWAWGLALGALGAATAAGWWMFSQDKLPMLHGLRMWWEWAISSGIVVGIALFAVLLGTDRRLWPWSLVPVAVLLSAGPTMFFAISIEQPRPQALGAFGMVIPLFLLGLLWSALRPLVRSVDGQVVARETRPLVARRVSLAVVLNVAAAGLLVASLVAYRNDPLAEWWARPLPTFLGDRNRANDVAARLNLADGLAAMKEYRREHGTFDGFRAADGAALAPQVWWGDLPGGGAFGSGRDVVPLPEGRDRAGLVTVSGSGAAWCIQTRGDRVTYGRSERSGNGLQDTELVRSALHHCGDLPWTDPMLDAPPQRECGTEPGYLICRMVQVLVHNVLARDEAPPKFDYAFKNQWTAPVPVSWHVREDGPQVRFWTGGGPNLLSLTVTDLGEAESNGEHAGYPYLPTFPEEWPKTDVTYTARRVVGSHAYWITAFAGRGTDPVPRQALTSLVDRITSLTASDPADTSTGSVPVG